MLIYKEKHEAYIVSIHQQDIRYVTFNGEKFCAGNDKIYYREYANLSNGINGVITVPDLIHRLATTQEELANLQLELESI